MTELNPCPRCGNEPDIFERNSRDISFQASCGECGDETFIVSNSANGAMNAWNAATGEQPTKTLRDEFAMAAISGYMTRESCIHSGYAEWAVAHSYEVADLMLKERRKC